MRLKYRHFSPRFVRSRRGLTLMELMVGLAVTGSLGLIAIPKIQMTVDRAQVKSARAEIFNRLATARISAQQGGRLVVFRVVGSVIWTEATPRLIPAAGSTLDTLGPRVNLASAYHVSVSTSLDSIVFDPRGLSTETGTIRVSSGVLSDSVAVTGFGSVIR
jgi:prepilin-type N-terminal cleavage/methylation domain-containing protein